MAANLLFFWLDGPTRGKGFGTPPLIAASLCHDRMGLGQLEHTFCQESVNALGQRGRGTWQTSRA
jgi:hypothetical protein